MSGTKIISFYDGHCGLCHMVVVFLLKRDRSGDLYFAPIQSERYKMFAAEKRISLTPRSIIVFDPVSNRMLKESAAVFYLLRNCGGFWRGMVGLCDMIPISFWNRCYRLVAGMRHRVFAKPEGLIPDLPPELMERIKDKG